MKNGFTMIELIIVIAILAIMVAIFIPEYQTADSQPDLNKCQDNLPRQTVIWKLQNNNKVTAERDYTVQELDKLIKLAAELQLNTTTVLTQESQTITKEATLVNTSPENEIAKQYLFKRNDEKLLTLKRHTITGVLYACYSNDECIKVAE